MGCFIVFIFQIWYFGIKLEEGYMFDIVILFGVCMVIGIFGGLFVGMLLIDLVIIVIKVVFDCVSVSFE